MRKDRPAKDEPLPDKNDLDRWNEVFERVRKILFLPMLKIANKDAERADQAIQEACVRFLTADPEDVRTVAHLINWLRKTATRWLMDHFRKASTRRERREADLDGSAHLPEPPPEANQGAYQVQVWEALQNLSPEDRDLLVAHYFESKSAREIAAAEMGVSPEQVTPAQALQVNRRWHQALGNLKRQLKKQNEFFWNEWDIPFLEEEDLGQSPSARVAERGG